MKIMTAKQMREYKEMVIAEGNTSVWKPYVKVIDNGKEEIYYLSLSPSKESGENVIKLNDASHPFYMFFNNFPTKESAKWFSDVFTAAINSEGMQFNVTPEDVKEIFTFRVDLSETYSGSGNPITPFMIDSSGYIEEIPVEDIQLKQ